MPSRHSKLRNTVHLGLVRGALSTGGDGSSFHERALALHGRHAVSRSPNGKKPGEREALPGYAVLVAGAGFEPTTFGL